MKLSLSNISVICFLGVFLVLPNQLTAETTPDDEDSPIYDEFLSILEDKTGLSNLNPNYTIDGVDKCSQNTCTVNPNGTLIWDIRYKLYEAHLIQGATTHETIDGCLKEPYNITTVAFNSCMEKVRTRMVDYMKTNFNSMLSTELNNNCTLIGENCLSKME